LGDFTLILTFSLKGEEILGGLPQGRRAVVPSPSGRGPTESRLSTKSEVRVRAGDAG
jgi:hypothetical protein